jgi:hypothetical protein
MKMSNFWDIALHVLVESGRLFRGATALTMEAEVTSQTSSIPAELHVALSQKTNIFFNSSATQQPMKADWVQTTKRSRFHPA